MASTTHFQAEPDVSAPEMLSSDRSSRSLSLESIDIFQSETDSTSIPDDEIPVKLEQSLKDRYTHSPT
jgi:hypothetical protein